MWLPSPGKQGFTLLELLVAAGLSLLLIGGSVAAYNNIAQKRSLTEAAKNLTAVLQRAQSRARYGDKPATGCQKLNGYRVWGEQNTQKYYLALRCDDNTQNLETAEYSLGSDEYFLTNFVVQYPPLPGAVDGTPVTIQIGQLTQSAVYYEMAIDQNGVVENHGEITN